MLGVVEVASLMPGLLVGLFAGALADRVVPIRMIVLMECAQMVLALVLAFLVWVDVFSVWQLALILGLARVCVTFELPSRQVFFFDLVGPESLSNAIALNSGLFNATRVVGPAFAGVGLSLLGAAGCFALNGLSYLAAIAAVLSIKLPHRPRPLGSEVFTLKALLGGLGYLRHDRRIFAQFLLVAFFGFVGMGYEAMIPAYTRTVVDTGVYGYSTLLACSGVGRNVRSIRRRVTWRPAAEGLAHDHRNGDFRCVPCGRGSLADFFLVPNVRLDATRRRIGVSARRWLRRGALLLVVDDAHPARGARPSPRPHHGYLDDCLFRLGPVWSALDRAGGTNVGRVVRDGILGGDLRRRRITRVGLRSPCTAAHHVGPRSVGPTPFPHVHGRRYGSERRKQRPTAAMIASSTCSDHGPG